MALYAASEMKECQQEKEDGITVFTWFLLTSLDEAYCEAPLHRLKDT